MYVGSGPANDLFPVSSRVLSSTLSRQGNESCGLDDPEKAGSSLGVGAGSVDCLARQCIHLERVRKVIILGALISHPPYMSIG